MRTLIDILAGYGAGSLLWRLLDAWINLSRRRAHWRR
jgi:hypothetical protein